MRLALLLLLVACAPRMAPTPQVGAETAAARPASTEVVVDGELGASLHAWLTGIERFGMAGVALVASEGEIVLRAAYGPAVRGQPARLTVDTPMVIGSLSKQFVAAAVLALRSEGRLTLDDEVARFFPDAPEDKRQITVEQLLVHTSGLPYLPEGGDFLASVPRPAVMEEMLAQRLVSPPGERHVYSSPGYALLAGIVEVVSGETYEDFVRGRLFGPAGMADTGFIGDARWARYPTVHAYTGDQDHGPLEAFPRVAKAVGAGDVVTTVDDLWRWSRALREGAVLPADEVEALFAPRVPAGSPNGSYGYGWNVIETARGRVVLHGGDLAGYNAEFRDYVDRGLVVVFLSNARTGRGGWRQAVMNGVSLVAAGAPHPEPPEVLELPAEALAAWEGTWHWPEGGQLQARLEGGAVVLDGHDVDAASLPPTRFLPESARSIVWFDPFTGSTRRARLDDHGATLWLGESAAHRHEG